VDIGLFHQMPASRALHGLMPSRPSQHSAVVALVDRQPWSVTETKMAPPVLGFAAVQCIERKQDLGDLAPEGCFIPAESVECIVGQIGETQKAMREFGVGIDRFRPGIGQRFRSADVAMRLLIGIETLASTCPNIA
jgi:hypothetical protein